MPACQQGLRRYLSAPLILAVLVFPTACGTLSTQSGESAEPKNFSLDGDMLYQLLAAEFAGNAGDYATSVEFYQQAAAKTDDSRVVARAAYIAMYNKQYELVLDSLARWQALAPEDEEINHPPFLSFNHPLLLPPQPRFCRRHCLLEILEPGCRRKRPVARSVRR